MTCVRGKLVDESGTLAGAAITMRDAVRYVATTLGLPLADALMMATLTPARLSASMTGSAASRRALRADLVHLTDALEVREVWTDGRRLDEVAAPN